MMMRKFTVLVGTALVALLALSGVAWAAEEPLAVAKTVPNGGATGIAPTANVKAYFNHDMRGSTVTSTTFKIRQQGTTTWLGATRSVNNTISPTSKNGSSQSVATLNPNVDLAANTTYQVVVVGGSSVVKDVNGSALSTNKSWTFTTAGATTSLTVLSSAPPASTSISTSTNVTATFSKDGNTPTDMLAQSINANTFWLTMQGDSANHLQAQITYDPATKQATLDPDFALLDGTSYTATIKGGSDGVKDTQGASLAQDYSWTFTTATVGGCIIIC